MVVGDISNTEVVLDTLSPKNPSVPSRLPRPAKEALEHGLSMVTDLTEELNRGIGYERGVIVLCTSIGLGRQLSWVTSM